MQIQEFPKWKYHGELPARIVNDPEQEAALGDGWVDHPDSLPTDAAPEESAPVTQKPARNRAKPRNED
jgi:hypothetical protein